MPDDASSPNPIQDAELESWLAAEGDDLCEVIVEARTPPRAVRFSGKHSGRPTAPKVTTAPGPDRAAVLDELYGDLRQLVGESARLLPAAGAIALRADREQLRQIVRHRLVKAVRLNRRLRSPS